jgi:purine nucleoside phosphorylase
MTNIKIAIIGGSGLSNLRGLTDVRREVGRTPYGDPSAPLTIGRLGDNEVIYLPRHGLNHQIPPHQVNYRANIWVLKSMGVEQVYAVGATGGIDPALKPRDIVIPTQLIDYTYGREQTYYDGSNLLVEHIDFSHPYSEKLRPEAALARELEMQYALISLVVNPAAGRAGEEIISMSEILEHLEAGMLDVCRVFESMLRTEK